MSIAFYLYFKMCRILGLFEVGIHIADVSYFVRPNTHLDDEAAERTTSVYLVQRVSVLDLFVSLIIFMVQVAKRSLAHWIMLFQQNIFNIA